jgi:hypothetical protein
MSVKHVPVFLLLAACAACAESSVPVAAGVTRVDSAGVSIVTSPDVANMRRLASTPRLEIGLLDGPEELQLFEVVGAQRLSDGRIAIANAGSHEVRFYGPGGEHIRSVGGGGEGPGEFVAMARLDASAEDSLYVWDERLRRLTVLGPSGEWGRDFRLEPSSEGVSAQVAGRFADGTFMALVPTLRERQPEDGELFAYESLILRYDAEGHVADTVGSPVSQNAMIQSREDYGTRTYSIPLDPGTQWTIADRGLHRAYGSRFEIRTVDGTGSLIRVARIVRAGRRVDADLRAAAVEARFVRFADAAPMSFLRAGYDMMPFPDFVAAYDRLLADETGRVWARRHPLPGENDAVWDVFDPTGALEAAVVIPVAATVWQVGEGLVLVSERDELDVERVALYDLEDADEPD